MAFGGDIATIYSYLARGGESCAPGAAWHASVDDAHAGARVSGLYFHARGASELAILVHGLGGNAQSSYMPAATTALLAQDVSVLRLAQRGADRKGDDLHHAGLWNDLARVLSVPPVAAYARVYLIGFSMGGHVALHLARHSHDRLAGVVAICSPLLLDRAVECMDQPRRGLYRHYLLRSLKQIYRAVALRRRVPVPAHVVDRARSLREWDRLTVVPRFGFKSTSDYYESQSVGYRLNELKTRSLLVYASRDPMVPRATLGAALSGLSSASRAVWVNGGGHVAFPRDCDLGLSGARGLYPQLVTWLRREQP